MEAYRRHAEVCVLRKTRRQVERNVKDRRIPLAERLPALACLVAMLAMAGGFAAPIAQAAELPTVAPEKEPPS